MVNFVVWFGLRGCELAGLDFGERASGEVDGKVGGKGCSVLVRVRRLVVFKFGF